MIQSPIQWSDLQQNKQFLLDFSATILVRYANTCRWFAGKARPQESFVVTSVHQLPLQNGVAFLLIVQVNYTDGGEAESYLLPLSFVENQGGIPDKGVIGQAIFAEKSGVLIDGIYDQQVQQALFYGIAQQQSISQNTGKITCQKGKGLDIEDINKAISSKVLPVDSSNSAMIFGDKYFLKLYRKLFVETNPEVDMVAFITENADFQNIPAFAGAMIWQQNGIADITLGMMQRMVENQKDSWSLTGDYLNDFMFGFVDKVFSVKESVFEQVELLARRTAEMHLALYAPDSQDNMFVPEPFTPAYRQFLLGRFSHLLDRRYALLIDTYQSLEPEAQKLAWRFMEAKELIDDFTAEFLHKPLNSLRIRVHGDYHLGQVLATPNNDYVIIDFEGEPESSIAERKIKHSPLKDVAGMIRSYHYAVSAKLFSASETEHSDRQRLIVASERWYRLMKDTFLESYLETFGSPHPLFKNNAEINYLMLIYLLEKAVYELGYELSYRPTWVNIPLKGIVEVIKEIEKLREA